jgi:uncharacterized repeat protein (TIGR04076 family)
MPSRCKVTVLKRSLDRELAAEYLDSAHADLEQCGYFREGQEFIIDKLHVIPEEFCTSARPNIRHALALVACGGDVPGMRHRGVEIAGCPDCFRAVIFKIERIE